MKVGLSQPHGRGQHPVALACAGPDPEARGLEGLCYPPTFSTPHRGGRRGKEGAACRRDFLLRVTNWGAAGSPLHFRFAFFLITPPGHPQNRTTSDSVFWPHDCAILSVQTYPTGGSVRIPAYADFPSLLPLAAGAGPQVSASVFSPVKWGKRTHLTGLSVNTT